MRSGGPVALGGLFSKDSALKHPLYKFSILKLYPNNSKNFFNALNWLICKLISLLTRNLPIKINNSFIDLAYRIVGIIFHIKTLRSKLSLSYLTFRPRPMDLVLGRRDKKFFSILHNKNNNIILHPYYITGFSDGESCFFINVRPRPARNKGYAVELLFKITLSSKDKLLLERIKNFFGVGRLLFQGSSVSYNVRSLEDLQIIINHFDKFPLISYKYSDYIVFRQVFDLMKDGQHLNHEGLKKIVSLKAISNKGLSENLKKLFPKVAPAIRPSVNSQDIPSPYWVAGFVEGEGSFYIKISTKNEVSFRFLVTQHIRDIELLKKLAIYLNCGYAIPRSNSLNHGDYFVTKKEEFIGKILPFFDQFNLQGNKLKDYLDFKLAIELKYKSIKLTPEKLSEIKKLKEGMNQSRTYEEVSFSAGAAETCNASEEESNSQHRLAALAKIKSNIAEISKRCCDAAQASSVHMGSPNLGFINKRHYSSWAMDRVSTNNSILRRSIMSVPEEQSKISGRTLFNKEQKFFEWLAGVIDGDGQFKTTKKGFSSLQIIMDIEDKSALYEIKHKFGGRIKQISGSNAFKYQLLNPKGLTNLVQSVNGLMRNPTRMLQLYKVCENYNLKFLEPKPLTYNNGWFSGFLDSDGSIYYNEKLDQLTISVTQKNRYLLDPLQIFYGGRIEILKYKEAFQFSIFRKNEILKLIDNYFKFNPLKSFKAAQKLNLIKDFYLLKDYKSFNNNNLEKFNEWILFKKKWDKL